MPKGFGAIQAAAEKMNSYSGDYQPVLKFKLPGDGDTGTVRALEEGEEVYSFWYHDFSHVNKAEGWKTKVPCLDQDDEGAPCPGCREDMPRKFQGLLNVIWRDAPVFKRDEDKRVIKKNGEYVVESYEDQVAVWEGGIELFNTLAKKDVAYSGLGSRDIQVERQGLKLKTKYYVEPADLDAGKTPLSKEDKELAKDKYNLEEVARFADESRFEEIIANYGKDSDSDDEDDDVSEFLNSEPFKDE